MSETVLFGKVKDPELVVWNFRGQLQCRMGGKREGPIETYPRFWNLNPALGGAREPDQHSRWEGTQLVQTRRLESADE